VANEARQAVPIVEKQFEEAGLPIEAASLYVGFLIETGNPNDPANQQIAMERAIGRVGVQEMINKKAATPQPGKVRLPGSEVGNPGSSMPAGVDAEDWTWFSKRYPEEARTMTPEKLKDYKSRGIL
jgi:hypothetical protein